MLIVILVMALLLTLVLTHGPIRSPTLELKSAASRVAQALSLARTEAIATGRPVPFVVDPAGHEFGPPGRMLAVPPGIAITASGPSIVFEPDGSARSGTIALGLGKMRLTIVVHWLNGRVSIDQSQAG